MTVEAPRRPGGRRAAIKHTEVAATTRPGIDRFSGKQRHVGIGWRLKALREAAGLSQVRLSELTRQIAVEKSGDQNAKGVGSFTITRQEKGRHAPSPENVTLLAEALTRALGRPITPAYLKGSEDGHDALRTYLERERARRGIDEAVFATAIGLRGGEQRYKRLLEDGDWTLRELGAIIRTLPETAPIIPDVIVGRSKTRKERADAPAEGTDQVP